MKKLFVILLSVLMLLSLLAGCGKDEEVNISGSIQPTATEPASESAVTEQEEKDLTIGSFEGGVYTNEYLGIGCQLDESWTFASAVELMNLQESVEDMVSETDLREQLEKATQISEMMAQHESGLYSMNIVYTKMDASQKLMYSMMSEKDILNALLDQSDTIVSSYEQMGILVEKMELVDVTFAGEQRSAIWTSSTVNGVAYYMLQLYDYDVGSYGSVITFASFAEDTTADMLPLFYKVN